MFNPTKQKEEMNMFNENLKAMRKAKGYTQEELAIKLNVVRQTVSKWEKGLSVPDADILEKIADVLETTVSTLLGQTVTDETDKNAVAEQLAKISEQLAIKNRRSRRIWKIIGIVLLISVVFTILMSVLFSVNTSTVKSESVQTIIEYDEPEIDSGN